MAAVLCLAPGLMAEPIALTGITEAIADVTLSTSVPGIVGAWNHKEGDFVKEGEAVIELDKRLEELESQRRKLTMDHLKDEMEALNTLYKKSSISVKKEDLRKAETDYKTARVEFEMAAEQLRKRTVFSPCAGHIVEILRDVGEACQGYQPLIRVVDSRQCYFVSNLESAHVARLKPDQTVKLEVETGAGAIKVDGKVVFLSPVVDAASGLQKIRVLFDNSKGVVRPGLAGRLILD